MVTDPTHGDCIKRAALSKSPHVGESADSPVEAPRVTRRRCWRDRCLGVLPLVTGAQAEWRQSPPASDALAVTGALDRLKTAAVRSLILRSHPCIIDARVR